MLSVGISATANTQRLHQKIQQGNTKMTDVDGAENVRNEGFKHGYALIIGVDDNKIQRLRLPVVAKDVQALHDVLIHPQRCGYLPENVRMLKGELATRENIFDSLYWIQDKVAGDNNATVIIYFSGHGMRDKQSGFSYYIPYDVSEISKIRKYAIRAESFSAEINGIEARRLLLIFDSNFFSNYPNMNMIFPSGSFSLKDYELETNSAHFLGKGMGKAILCSSNGMSATYVRKDGKMSIFTYHLIEALTGHATYPNNDNMILVTDIMSWIAREVPKTAESEGRVQIPAMGTTGVFPIASFYGAENEPLDPLEALSPEFQAFIKDYIDNYLQENPPVTNIYHGDHITATVTDSQGIGIGRQSKAEVSKKQQTTGDTYNMSGDFRGAMLNIKSSLKNVKQTIENMSLTDDSDKQLLQNLVDELEEALVKVPADYSDDAEAVAQTAEALVKAAVKDNPNKTMIQISGESLKQVAQNIADSVPDVPAIVTNILETIARVAETR